MSKRLLLSFFFIAFVWLNFFFTPSKVGAQATCAQCDEAYNACSNACGGVPISDACKVGCGIVRTNCVRGCKPGPGGPGQIGQFCVDFPEAEGCKRPLAGGDFASCGSANDRINTAIGCIPTSPKAFIEALIKYSYAIGGGVALIIMIIGAFQMMTSAGNPEQIKKGREQFVAAGAGLLFIVLSSLLLKIIGVDILAIPGF